MLFSVFFAAAWGWGCCIAASAPVWTGEVMFVLAVTGICCFFGIALLGMLLINAVLETRRFPPNGKPEPQGWPALPGAEAVCEQITRLFPGVSVSRLP